MSDFTPRVAAIHDLSGFGRCSLTVAIPVLSSMGIQVCPLPTAVLSTQTDGFSRFFFKDLTGSMKSIAAHWKEIHLEFDCIYSGFLASDEQVELVEEFIDTFGTYKKTMVIVDPVMGDNGKLYETYTYKMQKKMNNLVSRADIITPNPTEACFILGESPSDKPMNDFKIKNTLKALSDMGPEIVVITGVQTNDGCFFNAVYSRNEEIFWKIPYQCIPMHYPGTGDIFTSVLTGSVLRGEHITSAIDRAAQFVYSAISRTYYSRTPPRDGVLLERSLPELQNDLESKLYEQI